MRGNIHDQQVLHVGGAQFAAGKALGEIGSGLHLIGSDAAAQHHRSHVGEAGLLLRMNADVIAVNIVGRMLFDRGIELESDALLQFAEKTLGGPSMTQEEKFQAGALAMFAQNIGIAEQFGNALDHRQDLIPAHKCIQPRAEIRIGRKSAGDSQRESNFRLSAERAGDRGQANVIDLRIGAPRRGIR